jgi:spermidine synthase
MKLFQSWRIRKPEDDDESVYISEKSGVRTLHIGSDTIQSAMRIAAPNQLEIAYTRSMMAFLLFNPDPREILMIGLGGGSLAKFIYHQLAHAHTLAVEVNPRVVTVARQLFHVPADDDRLRVIVGDGSAHLKSSKASYEVILVDGYDAQSQVKEVATSAFYRDCARALGDDGILVVNLWGGDRDFANCVERIRGAFGGLVACLPAGKPGNVVALAFKRSPGEPRWEDLRQRAEVLEARHGLEFPSFVRELPVMNPNDRDRLLL